MTLPVFQSGRLVAEAVIDEDQASLRRYRWSFHKGYANRRSDGCRIPLHRVVLGDPPQPGLIADHINRDRLDNRRANLRWVTVAQSSHNKGPQRRNRTGLRGLTYQGKSSPGRPWQACVRLNGKLHSLGYYADPLDAARVASAWRRAHMSHAVEEGIGGLNLYTPRPIAAREAIFAPPQVGTAPRR